MKTRNRKRNTSKPAIVRPLFRVVGDKVRPVFPYSATGNPLRPNGKTILSLAQAAERFKVLESVLRDEFCSHFAGAIPKSEVMPAAPRTSEEDEKAELARRDVEDEMIRIAALMEEFEGAENARTDHIIAHVRARDPGQAQARMEDLLEARNCFYQSIPTEKQQAAILNGWKPDPAMRSRQKLIEDAAGDRSILRALVLWMHADKEGGAETVAEFDTVFADRPGVMMETSKGMQIVIPEGAAIADVLANLREATDCILRFWHRLIVDPEKVIYDPPAREADPHSCSSWR